MPHGAGTGPKGAKIFTVFIIPGNALSDSVLRCVPNPTAIRHVSLSK